MYITYIYLFQKKCQWTSVNNKAFELYVSEKIFPFHSDSEEYLIARWGTGIIPRYYTRRRMMPAESEDGA